MSVCVRKKRWDLGLRGLVGSSTANLKSLATQLSRWEHLLDTSEGCIPRETLDVGTHGARERPLRAVILVAARRMTYGDRAGHVLVDLTVWDHLGLIKTKSEIRHGA